MSRQRVWPRHRGDQRGQNSEVNSKWLVLRTTMSSNAVQTSSVIVRQRRISLLVACDGGGKKNHRYEPAEPTPSFCAQSFWIWLREAGEDAQASSLRTSR